MNKTLPPIDRQAIVAALAAALVAAWLRKNGAVAARCGCQVLPPGEVREVLLP